MNTLVYVLLVYLIYWHARGNNKEDNPLLLILIHFGLWFLVPVFGQNCLWLIGSCNYLWTTTIILLFLLLIRKNYLKDSGFKIIGMFILGIIAGWTNENTAFGLIVITLGTLIIEKREFKKRKILKYQLSGLIGSILGFIMLIIAPGNFVRSSTFDDNTFIVIKLLKRVIDDTLALFNYTLHLLIVITILLAFFIYNKRRVNKLVYIFL